MAPNKPPSMAQKPAAATATVPSAATANDVEQPAVNRKKQKRRQKQAAKLAAEQASTGPTTLSRQAQNGHLPIPRGVNNGHFSHGASHNVRYDQFEPNGLGEARDGDELFYSEDEESLLESPPHTLPNGRSRKKKKGKSRLESQVYHSAYHVPGQFEQPPPPPPPPPPATSMTRMSHNPSKDRIWNTSTAEERERIKEFWISLAEPERRSLVKVEKEAVLKKMKEQQKHSCSCSVCGRKRTAIEEELEVLYDAYYEELEQYANHRQIGVDSGHPIMPPPTSYSTMTKAPPRQDPRIMNSQPPQSHPMAGSFEEDDDDLEDEGYSEDEEDMLEESEEDYYPPEVAQGPAADFFNFGKSLTVQGGILTVADDLLKNDGKKFIEMMEQLAERRMQREEEAQYAAAGLRHPASYNGHNHPPMEEEEYDEEDDEEYASDEEEYEDDDEMESMSEEQRMEEGRRMFQIFAARMFEQRVLTAYREKVARERQEKLLEELADEDRLDAEREAKKAKDAQKKKERKKQQKMAKEEEKQKREAEKATAEAAAKAAEEEKLEEQRQRKEEQRKKREAERKAQEEERMRKEADKLRRQQEIREQQAEQERKQREARDKEKKRKEEAKKKEREERAREREKKDREVAEQLELEAKAKAEKEARGAFEKETKEKARKEGLARQHASQAATIAVSPLVRKTTSAIQAPPGLGPASSAHASPHLQIATPVIPKAPTPMRARQPSQQGSMHSSPKSTQPPSGSSATSPSSSSVQQPPPSTHLPSTKPPQTHQPVHPPTSMPTAAPPILPPPGVPAHPYPGMPHPPGMSGAAYPSHFHPMPLPGMQPRPHNPHDASIYATQPFSAPPYRGFNSPSTMAFPPGINGARQMPPGRGSPTNAQATQAPIGSGATPGQIAPTSHSRHASASYESSSSGQTQPIARPTPISRPTNAPQDDNKDDVEDLSKHLGSSALLDDTDQALGITANEARGSIGPSGMRSARLGFVNPRFPDGLGSSKAETFPRGGWNPPSMGFGTPTLNQHPSWPSAPSTHWSNSNAFGGMVNVARQPRPMTIRILICQACKALSNSTTEGVPGGFGYHSLHDVLNHIEQRQPDNGTIPLSEFLAICETEGSHLNGGGTLAIQEERSRGTCVKWIPDTLPGGNARMAGGPGEIGSPIVGSVMPFGSAGRGFPAHGGGMQTPNF